MKDRKLAVGWLEPNGTFHPCLRTEHEEVAYNIIGGSTNAYAKGWIACLGYEISCGFGMPQTVLVGGSKMTNAEKLAKDTEAMTDLVLGTLSPCYSCIYKNDVDGCNSQDCRPSIKKWLKSEADE